MKENPNIDELLNSFIDGELTEGHRSEVERLISHDAQAAKRLRELQKCKMLVSSQPPAEAPGQVLERIKASLAERKTAGWQVSSFDRREGARQFPARRVLTVAAMMGLVAVLGVVIYMVAVPEGVPSATEFSGRLELKAAELVAVDAAIKKAIEDNGLSGSVGLRREGGKSVYAINCSREAMSSLLTDLDNIWERFDSAKLFVETDTPVGAVVVDDVSTKQIVELMTPVKPDLTGEPEQAIDKPAVRGDGEKKVHLTIVLAGSE